MEGPSMSRQKSSWLRVHLGLLPTRTLVKRRKPVSTPTTLRAPATLSRALDSPPPSATRSGTTTSRALDTPPATRSGTTTSGAPDPPPPSATRSGTTTSRASDSPPPSATRSGTTTSRAPDSPPPSATRSGTTTSRVPEVQAGDEDTLDIDPLEESSDNVDSETVIAQLRRELRESEANLMKATTLRKDLLETNREIEERNEQLVREHTRQLEDLEQEKFSLSPQLANKESMERYRASEIESLQEKQKQETRQLKEGLDLEHSHDIQKVKATCVDLRSDLELAKIQNKQLKEQVNYLEKALEDAKSKASITILDETTSSEERLSSLQEEVVSLNNEKEEYAGPKNILGYDRVEAMAEYLMQFKEDGCLISTNQAKHIVKLWKNLHPHDRTIRRPACHQVKLMKGTKRGFLGINPGPASYPDANRIMECIFKKLNDNFPHHEKKRGSLQHTRWDHILHAYRNIRTKILACAHVTSNTRLQLINVNQCTLIQWHKRRSKDQERQMLEMAVSVAKPALVTSTPMPAAKEKPQMHIQPRVPNPIHIAERPNKAGQATMKHQAPLQTFVLSMPLCYQPPAFILPASSLEPRNVPPVDTTPASTISNRKRRAKDVMEGRQKRTYKPQTGPVTCRKCNQERDKEHHHQYFGKWYCKRTDQQSLEEWMQDRKNERNDRKKQKKE